MIDRHFVSDFADRDLTRRYGPLEQELHDRFGTLPAAADTLLSIACLRCVAPSAEIARTDAGPGAIARTPRQAFAADAAAAGLVVKNDRFILSERHEDANARVARTGELLEQLVATT